MNTIYCVCRMHMCTLCTNQFSVFCFDVDPAPPIADWRAPNRWSYPTDSYQPLAHVKTAATLIPSVPVYTRINTIVCDWVYSTYMFTPVIVAALQTLIWLEYKSSTMRCFRFDNLRLSVFTIKLYSRLISFTSWYIYKYIHVDNGLQLNDAWCTVPRCYTSHSPPRLQITGSMCNHASPILNAHFSRVVV